MASKKDNLDPEHEDSLLDSCKVCKWNGQQLQKHLRNNKTCSENYDTIEINNFFKIRAKNKRKVKTRLFIKHIRKCGLLTMKNTRKTELFTTKTTKKQKLLVTRRGAQGGKAEIPKGI